MKKQLNIILVTILSSIVSVSAQNRDLLYKKAADQWVAIPGGTLKINQRDLQQEYQGKKRQVTEMDSFAIGQFWISKTEVTNGEYLEFVKAIKRSGDTVKLRKVMPDTSVWLFGKGYNEPYVRYYFRHPAYSQYPVVGVSLEGAKLYCAWLTEKYNANLQTLLPKLIAQKIEFRLPTENEWMWAAKGGNENAIYPWASYSLRNTDKRFEGDFMCNIRKLGDGFITYDTATGRPIFKEYSMDAYRGLAGFLRDNASITAPVKAYWPSGYGLYNMAGNVAEMTATPGVAKGGSWFTYGYDAQIESPDPFQGDVKPKAFVGFRPIFVVIQ